MGSRLVWRDQEVWSDVVTRLVGLGALTGRPFALTGARVPAASALRCSRWTCIHDCRLAQVFYGSISSRLHPSQTTPAQPYCGWASGGASPHHTLFVERRLTFIFLETGIFVVSWYIECLQCILHASPIFGVCLFSGEGNREATRLSSRISERGRGPLSLS